MLSLSDLDDLHLIDLSRIVNAALIKGDNRTESITESDLYKSLDMTAELHKPVMIWVDNKGLAVTGNENSRSMSAGAARAFQVLANRHGCAVGMLMHPSNTGVANDTGASGSTANFAGYRSVIHMKKPADEEDKSVRVLECDLTNHAAGGVTVGLRWDLGRYICTDKPRRAGDDIGQADKDDRLFLKLLRFYIETGQEVSPTSGKANYAPKLFSGHSEAGKVTPNRFRKAMEALLHRKVIEVKWRGPPSKKVPYLVEVEL
jgi:RecA-family ATPase